MKMYQWLTVVGTILAVVIPVMLGGLRFFIKAAMQWTTLDGKLAALTDQVSSFVSEAREDRKETNRRLGELERTSWQQGRK